MGSGGKQPLARSIPISEVILGAGPYLRAAHAGPQSKGVGQWQLKHAMQGEFAAKKYYEIILDHFSTELGRGGHEVLTLLAAHASKRMDGST
jgi:hypothetical protein